MCEVECGERGVFEGGCGDGVRDRRKKRAAVEEVEVRGLLREQRCEKIKGLIDEICILGYTVVASREWEVRLAEI